MRKLYRFTEEEAGYYNACHKKTVVFTEDMNTSGTSIRAYYTDLNGKARRVETVSSNMELIPLVLKSIPYEMSIDRKMRYNGSSLLGSKRENVTIIDEDYVYLNQGNYTRLFFAQERNVYMSSEESRACEINKDRESVFQTKSFSNGENFVTRQLCIADFYPYIEGFIESFEDFLDQNYLMRLRELDSELARRATGSSILKIELLKKDFFISDFFHWSKISRELGVSGSRRAPASTPNNGYTSGGAVRTEYLEYFDPREKDEREISIWSEEKSRTLNFVEHGLMKDLRIRYGMKDFHLQDTNHVVIDSFVPKKIYDIRFNTDSIRGNEFPKTAVAISPWFAKMFGVKQMEIEQMCKILGYNKADISALMSSVKKKKKTLCMIGYGGTGVNTIHWLSEMANMVSTTDLFEQVSIFEKETAEISNLFRFPIDPMSIKRTCLSTHVDSQSYKGLSLKLNMIGGQLKRLSRTQPIIENRYYEVSKGLEYRPHHESEIQIDENGRRIVNKEGTDYIRELKAKDDVIFYGAPGLRTREELSKYGNFISATHGDNSCRLDLNPTQEGETQLQVESYGIIQLNAFFMNQLRMAIGLLETLSDPNFDPKAVDRNIMNFEFKGESIKRTDRTYDFNVENNLVLLAQ